MDVLTRRCEMLYQNESRMPELEAADVAGAWAVYLIVVAMLAVPALVQLFA